jgi:oligopeptide/dipeptide ABC transporter ATP-binding protein
MNDPIIEVKNLVTSFEIEKNGRKSKVNAVDGISFSLKRGSTLGIVGESGCGKSVTSLSIMRLIPSPPGKIESGEINFEGKNLVTLPESEMRSYRGNRISMIFQEPMTSLNPVFTVGSQIAEVFQIHKGMNKKDAMNEAVRMLRIVKIPSPETRVHEYPHQLSGGMRQRVMIAMALACEPSVLIADEPTTALDVTIQAQILSLMNELQETQGMSTILITHDLGVVAEVCQEVVVMYAGKVVEKSSVKELFQNPKHPYTKGLLASIPKLADQKKRLTTIPGMVPSLGNLPKGCRFQTRCAFADESCKQAEPVLKQVSPNAEVACFKVDSKI